MLNKKNRIVILFVGITILLLSCGNEKPDQNTLITGDKQSLVNWTDQYIDERVEEDKLDGGISVMIYSGGDVLYKNGAGWADKEAGKKIYRNTPMPVGSVSKIFTSVAIMKLVEDESLDLDIPVGIYLPRLKLVDGKEMDFTVRDLLTHHSGIQGDLFVDWFDTDKEVLYEFLKNRPMAADSGKLHSYANIGFSLLGLIIEEQSGLSYSDFIRNEIFIPAGMKNSLVYPGEIDRELPRGYSKGGSISVPVLRDIPAGGHWLSVSRIWVLSSKPYTAANRYY